jgi:hypothetical protein
MYFDSDFNRNTGVQGIDHKVEISWDKYNQTWTRVFEEWASGFNENTTKTLSKEPARFFTEREKSYITLSADLDGLISPDKYRVAFYAEVIDNIGGNEWIVDYTNWVSIPPPEIIVSILPSSMNLRQGHDSSVEVRVNSTINSRLNVTLFPQELTSAGNDQRNFNLTLALGKLHISPYGIAASPLHITAFGNTDVRSHTIVIRTDSVIPEESFLFSPTGSNQKSSRLPSDVTDETNVENTTFSVVVDKWDFNDQFNAFIDQWFTPLTAVYSTITGIISGIVGWIYGKRRKKDNWKNAYEEY